MDAGSEMTTGSLNAPPQPLIRKLHHQG